MKTKYYPVIKLCKEDLEWLFRRNKKALETIDKLTDLDMQTLAMKTGDALTDNGYWQILEDVFISRFLGY